METAAAQAAAAEPCRDDGENTSCCVQGSDNSSAKGSDNGSVKGGESVERLVRKGSNGGTGGGIWDLNPTDWSWNRGKARLSAIGSTELLLSKEDSPITGTPPSADAPWEKKQLPVSRAETPRESDPALVADLNEASGEAGTAVAAAAAAAAAAVADKRSVQSEPSDLTHQGQSSPSHDTSGSPASNANETGARTRAVDKERKIEQRSETPPSETPQSETPRNCKSGEGVPRNGKMMAQARTQSPQQPQQRGKPQRKRKLPEGEGSQDSKLSAGKEPPRQAQRPWQQAQIYPSPGDALDAGADARMLHAGGVSAAHDLGHGGWAGAGQDGWFHPSAPLVPPPLPYGFDPALAGGAGGARQESAFQHQQPFHLYQHQQHFPHQHQQPQQQQQFHQQQLLQNMVAASMPEGTSSAAVAAATAAAAAVAGARVVSPLISDFYCMQGGESGGGGGGGAGGVGGGGGGGGIGAPASFHEAFLPPYAHSVLPHPHDASLAPNVPQQHYFPGRLSPLPWLPPPPPPPHAPLYPSLQSPFGPAIPAAAQRPDVAMAAAMGERASLLHPHSSSSCSSSGGTSSATGMHCAPPQPHAPPPVTAYPGLMPLPTLLPFPSPAAAAAAAAAAAFRSPVPPNSALAGQQAVWQQQLQASLHGLGSLMPASMSAAPLGPISRPPPQQQQHLLPPLLPPQQQQQPLRRTHHVPIAPAAPKPPTAKETAAREAAARECAEKASSPSCNTPVKNTPANGSAGASSGGAVKGGAAQPFASEVTGAPVAAVGKSAKGRHATGPSLGAAGKAGSRGSGGSGSRSVRHSGSGDCGAVAAVVTVSSCDVSRQASVGMSTDAAGAAGASSTGGDSRKAVSNAPTAAAAPVAVAAPVAAAAAAALAPASAVAAPAAPATVSVSGAEDVSADSGAATGAAATGEAPMAPHSSGSDPTAAGSLPSAPRPWMRPCNSPHPAAPAATGLRPEASDLGCSSVTQQEEQHSQQQQQQQQQQQGERQDEKQGRKPEKGQSDMGTDCDAGCVKPATADNSSARLSALGSDYLDDSYSWLVGAAALISSSSSRVSSSIASSRVEEDRVSAALASVLAHTVGSMISSGLMWDEGRFGTVWCSAAYGEPTAAAAPVVAATPAAPDTAAATAAPAAAADAGPSDATILLPA